MTNSTGPRRYLSWADVPPGVYLTKTQLAELDLPRRPAPGPAPAYVDGYDFRDKPTSIDLYRIDESVPSPASARALAAARSRTGGPDPRLCDECGAHTERPCTVYEGGTRRCHACRMTWRLRAAQAAMVEGRALAAERAAELLADDRLAVVHVHLVDRGTTPSGVRRSPAAAHLTALDNRGKLLIETLVRLVTARSKGIPPGAIDVGQAAEPLRQALAGRRLLRWGHDDLAPLSQALRGAGWSDVIPTGHGVDHDLHTLTYRWRGEIDPRTHRPQPVTPPGNADRMHYLLQQIAASHQPPAAA